MALFEKIANTGQNVAQNAKNYVEISKINNEITVIEEEIRNRILALGRAYYEAYRHDPECRWRANIERVTAAYEEIARKQEQIKMISGQDACPHCQAKIAYGSVFCSICGQKIETKIPPAQSAPSASVCSACGYSTEAGGKFCMKCGTKL